MANDNATPLIVGGVVGAAAALTGFWLWRRNRAEAAELLTVEILDPPEGSFYPSGNRIDFIGRALVGTRDISDLIQWSVVQPSDLAMVWATSATTFLIPIFLVTSVLKMEAKIKDPVSGQSAKALRSVTVVAQQFPARHRLPEPDPTTFAKVSRVVPSWRRSDTGWQVQDRHVLEQPWEFARR